jgi:membrane protein involved in D-alanine export
MFKFSNILPFASLEFFAFMLFVILLILFSKRFFQKRIKFEWIIAFISFSYLFFLFPKPIQLFGLLIYLYGIYYLFARKLHYENLLLPIILISLPLFFMKFINVNPGIDLKNGIIQTIFQVAGLSFITFRVIQLYIDERENAEKVSFLSFFNFTTFIPTLLIGPLDKFNRFNTEIKSAYASINAENYLLAFNFLLKGLVYKFIIAEAINRFVMSHLINDGSVIYHLTMMYTYLVFLFFDFAGYSLLAMSFGKFIGISVPFNFDKPFLSENPKMFWQRWHKSLGDWLNDYFFKPVFKELTSKNILTSIKRQNIALFLTFTLMGFWNGFELHFIISGVLFGLYSMIHNYYFYLCKKNKKDVLFGNLNPTIVKYISIFILFNCVAIAIYIFSGKLF